MTLTAQARIDTRLTLEYTSVNWDTDPPLSNSKMGRYMYSTCMSPPKPPVFYSASSDLSFYCVVGWPGWLTGTFDMSSDTQSGHQIHYQQFIGSFKYFKTSQPVGALLGPELN